MGDHIETGVAILALTVVMISLKIVEHFLQKRRNGGRQFEPIDCPNKIHGLAETMHSIGLSLRQIAKDSVGTHNGVATLIEQHKPVEGVEQWKFTPALRQSVDGAFQRLGELLTIQEQQLAATHEMVKVATETLKNVELMQDRQINALKAVTTLQMKILAAVQKDNEP